MSDNDFAEEMQKFKEQLFKNFKHIPQEMIEFTFFISHLGAGEGNRTLVIRLEI